jgi:protein-tyrosine phosphatase
MWFEKLTGFCEESPEQVRQNISVAGDVLTSHVNGKEYICGSLETPSLETLRERVKDGNSPPSSISVRELIADVQELHLDPANAGALFQVASQFNLLEMAAPSVTPEQGVDRYEYDPTQGPACAIAAGSGTIYRNYFADVNGEIGQTSSNQIDCLADLGAALGNSNNQLWEMNNGYAQASEEGLQKIKKQIQSSTQSEIDELRKLLRIGVQLDTQVTLNDAKHFVSQTYCSALPVGYSQHSEYSWSDFAKLILDATYEATICAGVVNFQKTGNNKVYLTLVGGGVFGNDISWILNAIDRSLNLYNHHGLDIVIVSYGSSNMHVQKFIHEFNNEKGNKTINKPTLFSYQLSDNVWAGEYPGAPKDKAAQMKIEQMINFGITAFIDLTQEGELNPYQHLLPDGVCYNRFPIRDVSAPVSSEFIDEILKTMNTMLDNGKVIYLHCWGGTGRTGTVGACFLTQKENISAERAIELMRERFADNPKSTRRRTPDTPEQETFIINYIG